MKRAGDTNLRPVFIYRRKTNRPEIHSIIVILWRFHAGGITIGVEESPDDD
jgi:hypothetical protein